MAFPKTRASRAMWKLVVYNVHSASLHWTALPKKAKSPEFRIACVSYGLHSRILQAYVLEKGEDGPLHITWLVGTCHVLAAVLKLELSV